MNNNMNNNVNNGMNNGFNDFQQTPYQQPVVNQQPMMQPAQTQPVPPMPPQQQVYGQQQAFNQDPQQPKKGNKWIVIIGILIVVGIFVGGGILLLNNKKDENSNILEKKELYTKFEADFYMLTNEEGGRRTPVFANYRPIVKFGNAESQSIIILPEDVDMIMPGDSMKITFELFEPIKIKNGEQFEVYEAGIMTGRGTVTKIIK